MKIAFFTETYPPYINGVATQTEILKRTFEEMGHEVLVVTVGSEKLDVPRFENNVAYMPGYLLKRIYNYRIAKRVSLSKLDFVKEFNPDIIHIQNEFSIGHAGIRFSREYNIPYVYMLHSEYDQFLFYVGLKRFNKISRKLSDEYLKKLPNFAEIVLSPSKKAQKYIDRQKIKKEVVVIENSVENKLFSVTDEKIKFREEFRKKYQIDYNCKAFVFVGRIGREKNIFELINNFIYADLPKEKAKLFIIGGGPDSEEINQIIKDSNSEDRIISLGSILNTEIPKYLYAMDYYTTASLSEMHSISMLEGMASGLPALIKLDEPNKDQIKTGINGYQWDTKEEFKELFTNIINLSEEEAKKLKDSTLEYSKNNDNFSQARKLINVYKTAIEMSKNKG